MSLWIYGLWLVSRMIMIKNQVSFATGEESLVVFEFDAIGIDEQSKIAATQILRDELNASDQYYVISRREMESILV